MADPAGGENEVGALGRLETMLDAIHKRLDDDDARRARHDDRQKFSHRRDDDDDDKVKSRHDAEEGELAEALEKGGVPKEKAADRAKRARKDAERCDDDARKHFTDRKDDDDDDKFKARRDAEEEELAKEREKEGESREDARRMAHDARRRRDDDDDKKRRDDAAHVKSHTVLADDDKKRKDDDDKKRKDDDDKKRRDDARADAAEKELKSLREKYDNLAAQVTAATREVPHDERNLIAATQSRADSVAVMFGARAPQPMFGETALAYRKRCLSMFQKHSKKFEKSDFSHADAASLDLVEKAVYADAETAARSASAERMHQIVPFVERDHAGRQITKFYGDPLAWMGHFMTGGQTGRIVDPRRVS
jgi:hypothetical protein